MLHFFDVTLRNSTGKICKHDCRGAAVLARDDVRARRGDERRPRLARSPRSCRPSPLLVARRRRCQARRRRGNIRSTADVQFLTPLCPFTFLAFRMRRAYDFWERERERERGKREMSSITADFDRATINR